MTRYTTLQRTLTSLLDHMTVLVGDKMGESSECWQDVARHASADAMALGQLLADAAEGRHESFLCFPSPEECLHPETEETDRFNESR